MHLHHHASPGTRVQRAGRRGHAQRGFTLIETMAALLIFGVGVLGIARLQSVAVQETTSAGFRADAALLSRNLIGRMWMSDRTTATLQTSFASTPAGAGYTAWMAAVTAAGLPGAAANPPTVVFKAASSQVTITVFWRAPGDASVHSYVETAQVR